MKKTLIYITLVIMVLGGCKKVDLPAPVIGDPVFSVNALIGNDSLNWIAGDNDVFMFTEFSKDSLDIYTLTGRFAKDENCTGTGECDEYLSFSIRGNEVTPTINDFVIGNALENQDYFFVNNSLDTMQVGLKYTFEKQTDSLFPPNSNVTYNWTINSDLVTKVSTGDSIQFSYLGNNNIEATLEVESNSSFCSAFFTRKIENGMLNNQNIEANIISFNPNNNELIIEPVFTNFPDSTEFTLITIDTMQQLFSNVSFPLEITPNGGTFSIDAMDSSMTDTLGYFEVCISGQPIQPEILNPKFSYIIEPIISISSPNQLSKVLIEYQDINGVKYNSVNSQNNSTNSVTISKIEEFEVNDDGEKTKKFMVNYNCMLADSLGNEIPISGESIMAVAYPSN